ncbi:MAG: DUF4340 domain-containing protein [Eubacteriales bacterium]|nr:DUF4340 domain-containing protein [Eubacteriales bacterium]
MKKKKKGKLLILGIVVLVVLGGLEIALKQANKKAEEQETEETEGVDPLSLDSDQLKSVTVKNAYGMFSLTKEEDTWENAEDAEFPLSQSTWTGKLSYLESMEVVRTLEEPAELAEYGLEEPEIEITMVMEDGGESHLYIGDQNVTTGDFYVYVDSPEAVYTVGSSLAAAMDCKLYDLAEMEEFPEVDSDTLYYVKVQQGEETLEFFNENAEDSYSGSWTVSRDGDEAIGADSSAMSLMKSALSSLDFEELVDYKGEDLELYGLEEPGAEITWRYTVTETVETEEESEAETETGDEAESDEETETETETEPETITVEKEVVLLVGAPIYAEDEGEEDDGAESESEVTETAESESEGETAEGETESGAGETAGGEPESEVVSGTEEEAESEGTEEGESEASGETIDREIEGYYVKLSDSAQVYRMSADTLADWLGASYTDYVDKYISQVPQTALETLTVSYEGEDYVLTIESETKVVEETEVETEEDGTEDFEEAVTEESEESESELGAEESEPETETVYYYLVNGEETDETSFLSFYGAVTGMTAQTIVEGEVSGEPTFALKFEKTDGTEVTAEYYLGKDGMYTVLCGNGLCGKVNKLEADDMIELFKELIE